jgi:hypothetical protein
LHKLFWQELSEDNPDLINLSGIGENISKVVTDSRSHFMDLLKIN